MANSEIKYEPQYTMGLGDSANIWDSMKNEIESSFSSASNYKIFTGQTTEGQECGWIGYKHNNNKVCYGIVFNNVNGIVGMKRETNGSWMFKKLWGG